MIKVLYDIKPYFPEGWEKKSGKITPRHIRGYYNVGMELVTLFKARRGNLAPEGRSGISLEPKRMIVTPK